jgi:2-polyprenyl-6-methoxyphenol hydroxylase-like FAD-dependent oxidoreductase
VAGHDVDVLVVGAGPTGLMLAHELACRSARVRVIDRNRDRARESRALVVHARSLELLDRWGLAETMVDRGRKTLAATGHTEHGRNFDIELGDIGVDDTRYPFLLFLSQAETEAVLSSALEARGVRIERETELVSFEHDREGVTATLRAKEGTSTVRVAYLAGCDGAHSTVRHGLGVAFEGAPYQQDFILADADVETDLRTDRLHFFLRTRGLLAMFPFRERNFVRFIGSRARTRDTGDEPPTRDEVASYVDELSTAPIRVANLRWSSRYHLHHRAAERFRVGRVFLCGDAAHIHSPAGGQGMNTGLQDAANLGWKLADVLDGRAAEPLLESYEAERLPVARWLLRYTDRLFLAAAAHNPLVVRVRNALLPRLVTRALSTPERRRRAFRYVSQLAISYRDGPIIGALEESPARGPRPGDRAPDAEIERDGKRLWLSEATRELDHFLLVFGAGPVAAGTWPVVRVMRSRGDGALVDPSGAAFRRYGVEQGGVFAIRADRYLAVTGPGADAARAVELADRLLWRG